MLFKPCTYSSYTIYYYRSLWAYCSWDAMDWVEGLLSTLLFWLLVSFPYIYFLKTFVLFWFVFMCCYYCNKCRSCGDETWCKSDIAACETCSSRVSIISEKGKLSIQHNRRAEARSRASYTPTRIARRKGSRLTITSSEGGSALTRATISFRVQWTSCKSSNVYGGGDRQPSSNSHQLVASSVA